MLGKRPRPNNFLRKSTSKSQLLSYGNSINKDSPQQVVVGFKLAIEAAEKRRTNPNTDANSIPNPNPNCNPYQACESPKSVLELCTAPRHSSSCRHSHRAALRSPRSVLGSLLISAGNPVPAGIGLGIVVAIKAEEIAAEEAEAEAAKLMNDESELSRSKLVSLKSDPIPIMVSGLCNSKENCEEESHSFHGEGEDEEEEEDDDDDERKAEIRSNIHRKINQEEEAEDFSLNLERKMIKEEADDEEEDDDDETEMERIRESIFSTASPAATNNFCSSSNSSSHGSFHGSTHFLSFCCLCKRPLSQGRDIFMYRGDLGFCSAECRYQQIVLDDRKERMLSSSSSSSSSSTTPNCYAMHTHTLPATAAARAAVA